MKYKGPMTLGSLFSESGGFVLAGIVYIVQKNGT